MKLLSIGFLKTFITFSDSTDASPVRRTPKLCAVHGSKLRSESYSELRSGGGSGSKLRSGSYSATKSPSPPPPPPPPPFASVSDCSESLPIRSSAKLDLKTKLQSFKLYIFQFVGFLKYSYLYLRFF
jgi:hypothetical protein